MTELVSKTNAQKVGQLALHAKICPEIPEPPVHSYVFSGARRTIIESSHTVEFYPVQYATDDSLLQNLVFAFKYEPLDLRIVIQTLKHVGSQELGDWISSQPTGAYTRRAWFLYEKFIGRLELPDASAGNYVDALDSEKHYVAEPINSKRHRVRDNLLGSSKLCPVLRRTDKLRAAEAWNLAEQTAQIARRYNTDTIVRAINYLYTKETRSSYAIEGERPSPERESRFLAALRQANQFFPADKAKLLKLQGTIVDPRYAATDWRDIQNFVGETTRGFGEFVHFVCPKPEDVPDLMQGWFKLSSRLLESSLDPILAAAISAFAFVFIHPFEDGNGRIHRFIVHAFLATKSFGPPGIILPVSAAILRKKAEYEQVLEAFSRPLMTAIQWDFLPDDSIKVRNETRDLYRFFDATLQAEFLFARAAEAVTTDLIEEAEFLETFDAAWSAVRAVIDMPDRRARLLIELCLNNHGRLSNRKRAHFSELTDGELQRIEAALTAILQRTKRLSAIGWSESGLRQKLTEGGFLKTALQGALDQLEARWSRRDDEDELDYFDEHTLIRYQIDEFHLDEVELEHGQAYVKVTCEVLFELQFQVVVANTEQRVYDPEDSRRVILQPPTHRTTLSEEIQRTVFFQLTLQSEGRLELEDCQLEDRSPLRIGRPDPDALGNWV